jgi:hypothetical protein
VGLLGGKEISLARPFKVTTNTSSAFCCSESNKNKFAGSSKRNPLILCRSRSSAEHNSVFTTKKSSGFDVFGLSTANKTSLSHPLALCGELRIEGFLLGELHAPA